MSIWLTRNDPSYDGLELMLSVVARTDKRYTNSDTIRINFEIDREDPYMAPTLINPPVRNYIIRSDDDRPTEWVFLGSVKSPLAIENERFSVTLYSSYCIASSADVATFYDATNTITGNQCPF